MKIETARRLRVGDALSPTNPMAPRHHTVRSIAPDQEVHGNLRIETNYGSWSIHPDAKLTFPRRDDGSTVDWTDAEKPPLVRELCVGDTLPPSDPHHPSQTPYTEQVEFWLRQANVEDYSDLPEFVQKDLEQEYFLKRQEVTSVWQVGPHEWGFACYEPFARTTRTYRGHIFEAVTFPRKTVGRSTPSAIEYTADGVRKISTYGPYEHKLHETFFIFATHPFGRGRWPGDIPKIDVAERRTLDELYTMVRPPTTAEDWSHFIYLGASPAHVEALTEDQLRSGVTHLFEPHPRDPRMRDFVRAGAAGGSRTVSRD